MSHLFETAGAIAGRQHGRISHAQLLAAGVDRERIKRWRADGRLRRVHVGVYAVGHAAPSLLGDLMAAVLAAGEGAVVSHRSAAHVFGLLQHAPPAPEVTIPTIAGRRRAGIVVHRVGALPARDVTDHQGIPTTTVPRTLVDLAPSLAPALLGRACHEAWIRHRTTPAHVEACIARSPARKGVRKLRIALGADVTLSDLEDGFLALLRRHELALPRTNVDHAADKVDCHWPDRGLTIELLSFTFHGTRRAFEADVARRRRSGHVAFTWGDVFERGDGTAREVTELLASASARERERPRERTPARPQAPTAKAAA